MKQTWKMRVRKSYGTLESLRAYDSVYGIAKRCGFRSAIALWRANPMIGGSSNPAAFGIAH